MSGSGEAAGIDRSEAEAAARLASVGLRRTPGRVRLLGLLMRRRRPMSPQQVHEALGPEAANRVSVYRALDAFVAKGLVHRACVDQRTGMFESADRCAQDHCHPHFTCRSCGAIRCLADVEVPLIHGLGGGYRVERQQVHLVGLCPECAAEARNDEETAR